MNESFVELFRSVLFWAAVCSWFVAQTTKMLCGIQRTGRVDFRYLASLGGMPSAHSAMVSGLATSVGLQVGFGNPLFVVALAMASVVMFDAATVRRAASHQARLLNEIVAELFQQHRLPERKLLGELLGHTRLEVFMGMVIGVLTAMLVHSLAHLR